MSRFPAAGILPLCVYLANYERKGIKMLGNVVIQKKNPTITQDLSRRSKATKREIVSTYPRIPKAEALCNAVDVVERLHDPTDPSTERTAPPCSAHIQHDDIPRALDPVEGRRRVPSARWRGDGGGETISAGLRQAQRKL